MVKIFVKKLQQPVREGDEPYSEEMLLKGIEVAQNLWTAIANQNKNNEKLRKDKSRSMLSVLTQYPHMRKKLLTDQVSCDDFCNMKRDDFLTTELRRQKSEAEEARMNS